MYQNVYLFTNCSLNCFLVFTMINELIICMIILPYSVNLYCSHGLIATLIWPIAGWNNSSHESQNENTEKKKGRVWGDASQPPEEQDVLQDSKNHEPCGKMLINKNGSV